MVMDIVSLGSCNMDFILKVPNFVEPDGEMYVEDILTIPGGSALNFAVNISGHGLRSGFISRIGDDRWGTIIKKELVQRGVDVSGLITLPKPTGMAFISVDHSGKRSIYSFSGVNEQLALTKEDINYIKSSNMLHLAGTYWEVAREAAKHAEIISFDPGSLLSVYGLDKLKPVLKKTDLLFLSEKEVEIFTSLNLKEGANLLIDEGASNVIITLGEKGALLYNADGVLKAPTKKIKAVDTTGAGDAFAAAFVSKWLSQESLEDSLKFANQCAALQISQLGGI